MNAQLPPPDIAAPLPPAPTPTPATPGERRLVRPREGRRLAGVCAGIADKYGWSRTTVRVLALLSVLLPGPQVLAYVVAWFVVPDELDGRAVVAVDVDKATGDLAQAVRR